MKSRVEELATGIIALLFSGVSCCRLSSVCSVPDRSIPTSHLGNHISPSAPSIVDTADTGSYVRVCRVLGG